MPLVRSKVHPPPQPDSSSASTRAVGASASPLPVQSAPRICAVAWVKWLTGIEVHDRKFLGRFMGRDYVTIRSEKRGDQTIWRETSAGK